MRIVLCHSYYRQRGGEDFSYEQEAEMLESRGHDVLRLTQQNRDAEHLSSVSLALKTVWNRSFAHELRDACRQFRPQIVHFTNTFPMISLAAYYAAKAEGAAVVQAVRNYRFICPQATLFRNGADCTRCVRAFVPWPAVAFGCYRGRGSSALLASQIVFHRLLRSWQRKVDLFYAPSAYTRSQLVEAGFPEERFFVKPNFLPRPPQCDSRERSGALFVGRLVPEKGVSLLLDTWRGLDPSLSIPLKIIGAGPLQEEVVRAAAADSRIEYLGELPWEGVLAAMGQAQCVIVPSLWQEPFGRTVVEALAMGTPVIVARRGAMHEIVEDEQTGLHFEPNEPGDLARSITRFWSGEFDHAAMRRRCLEAFEERYTEQANYEQLTALYDRALQNSCGQRNLESMAGNGRNRS